MLVNIHGAKCAGIEALPVTIEVDISSGIGLHLVGLADAAVKESLLRTVTALRSLGYRIPGRKIVINLAPADMHKSGSGYDLPIAIAIIAASGQHSLPGINDYVMMGELGLDGEVRSTPGALPIAELAASKGMKGCIFPVRSAAETIEYDRIPVFGVRTLNDAIRILECKEECDDLLIKNTEKYRSCTVTDAAGRDDMPDFADIYGQESAKRGMEIAAAGGHNIIMVGPPGSGKSTLAHAMAGILPPMSTEEAMQTSKIYSVAGKAYSGGGLIKNRPFRAPHYSTSMVSILGGGSDNIMPGEISLAHNGILFIDEFCEAPKKVTESLRGPMEERKVTISRLRSKVEYPASFMLVAATNPCPCGYYGEGDRCRCSPGKRISYISKLSGPLMDRIDIHLWLHPADPSKLARMEKEECSKKIAERVYAAREIQRNRFTGSGIFTNAEMTGKMTLQYCRLSPQCTTFLEKAIDKMGLSARAGIRILKIARTIADLAGEDEISIGHLAEATGYRFLDRI